MNFLVLLKHVFHNALSQPRQYICPYLEWNMVFLLQQKRNMCSPLPCLGIGREPLATGDQCTVEMLILLHLFFLWVKHCSNQHLVGQDLWAPTSGGWHCYSLLPLPSGNPHLWLVAGSSHSTISVAKRNVLRFDVMKLKSEVCLCIWNNLFWIYAET